MYKEKEEEEEEEKKEILIEIEEIKKEELNFESIPLKLKAKSDENLLQTSSSKNSLTNSSNTLESPKSNNFTKSNVSDSLCSIGKDVFSPRSDDSKSSSHSVELSDEKTKKLSTKEKFFVACYTGDYETLLSLFEENPEIDINKIQNKTTLLHAAAANNCSDIIELLLNKGGNINVLDSLERTPLHVAVSNGNYEASITLLGQGTCRVNSRDCYGYSPLFLAIKNHNFEIAEDLILFNGDINFKRQDGSTVLHDCLSTNNMKSLKFLLDLNLKNLFLNPKDSNGETPLMKGIAADHIQIVKYFHSRCQKDLKLLSQNSNGQNKIDSYLILKDEASEIQK